MASFNEFIKGFEENPKKFKAGDIVVDKKGNKFRVESRPNDEMERIWGKDHTFVQRIDDSGKDIYDYGSRAYVPNGQLSAFQKKK